MALADGGPDVTQHFQPEEERGLKTHVWAARTPSTLRVQEKTVWGRQNHRSPSQVFRPKDGRRPRRLDVGFQPASFFREKVLRNISEEIQGPYGSRRKARRGTRSCRRAVTRHRSLGPVVCGEIGRPGAISGRDLGVLALGAGKLALVSPNQHPPHIAVRVDEVALAQAARDAGKPVDRHRDGTRGIYVTDLDGNQVELICYPDEGTVYR